MSSALWKAHTDKQELIMEKKEIIIGEFKGQRKDALTTQQLIALLYMANEYSAKQAAKAMAISHRTVEKHINLAKEKLGGKRSVLGVCIEAFKRGIIAPLSILLCIALAGGVATETRTTTPAQRPSISRTVRVARSDGGLYVFL